MADISQRDINIFRILSSGPVRLETIRASLVQFSSEISDSKSKQYSYDMSTKALCLRLSKLKKDGFINSRKYRDRYGKDIHTLYSLTPLAIDVLADQGVNPADLKFGLPPNRTTKTANTKEKKIFSETDTHLILNAKVEKNPAGIKKDYMERVNNGIAVFIERLSKFNIIKEPEEV